MSRNRNLRRGAAYAAGTVLMYGGLLAVTADNNPLLGTGWAQSTAETARPYAAAVTDAWWTFTHTTAHLLTRVEAFAIWPLLALTLLWLASRNQQVYLRSTLALFVTTAAGLLTLASLQGFPAGGTSLVRDYLALPGVHAGWYVLMAPAVVAATESHWVRAAATGIALSASTAAVLTADHHLLGALWAVGVPLLAWYGVATPWYGRSVGRRRSQAAVTGADVVPLRPRAGAPERRGASEPVPLPQAG